MRLVSALALLMLAGCSPGQENADQSGGGDAPDLETAAIERGLIRDPDDAEIAGLYARDGDRLCIVPEGYGYRLGAFVDYGDGIQCTGSGSVTRVGETMRVDLGGACSFDARYDGERIIFPGAMPEGCADLCTRRASFAGFEATFLSASIAEAAAMRGPGGERLCAGSR